MIFGVVYCIGICKFVVVCLYKLNWNKSQIFYNVEEVFLIFFLVFGSCIFNKFFIEFFVFGVCGFWLLSVDFRYCVVVRCFIIFIFYGGCKDNRGIVIFLVLKDFFYECLCQFCSFFDRFFIFDLDVEIMGDEFFIYDQFWNVEKCFFNVFVF